MSKQNVRNGRLGRIARQNRAWDMLNGEHTPIQEWDDERKVWLRLPSVSS